MRKLSYEFLERRAMLAVTPQVLVDQLYDPTNAVGPGVSDVFQLDDKFVAVASPWASDYLVEQSDGAGESQEIVSFAPPFLFQRLGGVPDDVVELNDKLILFFDASSTISGQGPGQQLWEFEVDQGLRRIAQISELGTKTDSLTGFQDPFQFAFNDHLYFMADATVSLDAAFDHVPGDYGLWRTDGSEAGTVPVDLIPGLERIEWSVELNDRLLLSTRSDAGPELWTFDGTPEGTRLVSSSAVTTPTIIGDLAYFSASSDASGRELYVSDGTVAGTQLLIDLNEGPGHSAPRDIVEFEQGLVFSADPGDGRSLWYTDGTIDGTQLLHDDEVTGIAVADQLYFTTGDEPYELYRWNGDEIVSVLSATSEIQFEGSTDEMLLFRSGEDHYTIGSNHSEFGPVEFELPGQLQLTTSQYFVFTTESLEPLEIQIEGVDFPLLDSNYAVQLWVSEGTNQGTRQLGEPTSDQGFAGKGTPLPIGSEFDEFRVLGVEQIDGYLTVETFSYRFEPNFKRIMVSAYELAGDASVPGDADRDGKVDFTDFLVLSANFGKVDAIWADGDFDESGLIDFADFLLLSENFGRVA